MAMPVATAKEPPQQEDESLGLHNVHMDDLLRAHAEEVCKILHGQAQPVGIPHSRRVFRLGAVQSHVLARFLGEPCLPLYLLYRETGRGCAEAKSGEGVGSSDQGQVRALKVSRLEDRM